MGSNHEITSREAILAVSRKLIMEKGRTALTIRTVAGACGISVGAVYHYFGTKAELIAATIESIWNDIFQFPAWRETPTFLECIQWMYARIEWGSDRYPGFFALHAMSFLEDDKPEAKKLMTQSWRRIQSALERVLISDPMVRPNAFTSEFSPHSFCKVVFSMVLSALIQEDYDWSAVAEMVRRVLY